MNADSLPEEYSVDTICIVNFIVIIQLVANSAMLLTTSRQLRPALFYFVPSLELPVVNRYATIEDVHEDLLEQIRTTLFLLRSKWNTGT